MRAASLFSGIGAPEVAMPGWQWLWHAEIEAFPSAVMAARHPGSINLGDVSAPDFVERALDAGRPDIIVFGSPCQSFSVAGKRLGMDDPRGNLALVALAVVRRLRPRWFLFENVPGLLSSAGGRDFGAFLGAVVECGYGWAYRVLDAQHFGVPQRRRRVFVVGHLGDWRPAASVLFEPASLRWNPAPGDEARQAVAAGTGAGATERGWNAGADADRAAQAAHRAGAGDPNAAPAVVGSLGAGSRRSGGRVGRREAAAGQLVARSLNAHRNGSDGESETFVTHSLRADGFDASEDGTGRGTPLVPVAFLPNDPGSHNDGTAPSLRAGSGGGSLGSRTAIAMNLRGREGGAMPELDDLASVRAASGGSSRSYVATAVNETMPTLCRDPGGPASQDWQWHAAAYSGSAVRRLTPRETERLQGFPDDWTLIQYRGKPAADGPRYKACGNSMAVPCIRWILERIGQADAAMHGERAAA